MSTQTIYVFQDNPINPFTMPLKHIYNELRNRYLRRKLMKTMDEVKKSHSEFIQKYRDYVAAEILKGGDGSHHQVLGYEDDDDSGFQLWKKIAEMHGYGVDVTRRDIVPDETDMFEYSFRLFKVHTVT